MRLSLFLACVYCGLVYDERAAVPGNKLPAMVCVITGNDNVVILI